jgi:hypothetical protein
VTEDERVRFHRGDNAVIEKMTEPIAAKVFHLILPHVKVGENETIWT